jgi:hypothetical protein
MKSKTKEYECQPKVRVFLRKILSSVIAKSLLSKTSGSLQQALRKRLATRIKCTQREERRIKKTGVLIHENPEATALRKMRSPDYRLTTSISKLSGTRAGRPFLPPLSSPTPISAVGKYNLCAF